MPGTAWHPVALEAAVSQDLPGLHAGEDVLDACANLLVFAVVFDLPLCQLTATRASVGITKPVPGQPPSAMVVALPTATSAGPRAFPNRQSSRPSQTSTPQMIERFLEAGHRDAWINGDEIYGGNPKPGAALEARGTS